MSESLPITYRDVVALPDETTLQTAAEIVADLRGPGDATLNAEGGTVSFEFECEDLWEACETAHEIAGLLNDRGIAYDLSRDCLVPEAGHPTPAESAASAPEHIREALV